MKLTNIAIKRPVFTIMIYIAILLIGITSLSKLSLDFFPELEFPVAMVMTQYNGVGPKDMESTITKTIEGAVASVSGIDKLMATSKEGVSTVIIQFEWGTDLDSAIADVRDKLDLVKDRLPDGAEKPMILKFSTASMPVIILGLKGSRSIPFLYDLADDKIKNKIEQVDGIASMAISGVRKKEIHVLLKRNRLDAYGFSPQMIINILRAENVDASGGNIKRGNTQFNIRTTGKFKNIKEIQNIILSYRRGVPIFLKYVADVKWEISEEKETVGFEGEKALQLVVFKQSGANTVQVVKNLSKKLIELKKILPPGVTISVGFDTSDIVTKSIMSLAQSAILGGMLAILIVLFFMRNVGASMIIGLSIPLSVIGTFIAMYFSGITLNVVSMGGLALGIGMLVDNGIVVLENIFHYLKKGQKPTEAARLGTNEVSMAIFSSTLTTVSVFLPILLTAGLAKEIFQEMALTISFSLLASLFVSLTLIPMLAAKFLKHVDIDFMKKIKPTKFKILTMGEKFVSFLENKYKKGIIFVLKFKKSFLLGVILLLIFTVVFVTQLIKFEFMPEVDEGLLTIDMELPVGTRLKTTKQAIAQFIAIINKIVPKKEIKTQFYKAGLGSGFSAVMGANGSNIAQYRLLLISKTKRSSSIFDYRKKLKEMVANAPAPLGITSIKFSTQGGAAMMGGGAPIDILVRGYNLEIGKGIAKKIQKIMKKNRDLYNIEIGRKFGVPELNITIDRIKAGSLGLNIASITSTVEQSILGTVATRLSKDGKEYDILVRLQEKDRRSVEDLQNIQIISSFTGKPIRLANIASIERKTGPTTINRDSQERVIHVSCSSEAGLKKSVDWLKKEIGKEIIMPDKFSLEYSGNFKDMEDTFGDLAIAIIVAIILVYAIMASIFESFLDPFIIFFTMPLSLIGVLWALFVSGTSLNVQSFIGILILMGIVVNNGIVLVDYINILRGRGFSLYEAIAEGGRRRLRPILMTSITTILAMLPMAIGMGEGAESSAPMAISVVGGLATSTIFSLFVIPIIYMIFESLSIRLKTRKDRKKQEKITRRNRKYGIIEELK